MELSPFPAMNAVAHIVVVRLHLKVVLPQEPRIRLGAAGVEIQAICRQAIASTGIHLDPGLDRVEGLRTEHAEGLVKVIVGVVLPHQSPFPLHGWAIGRQMKAIKLAPKSASRLSRPPPIYLAVLLQVRYQKGCGVCGDFRKPTTSD